MPEALVILIAALFTVATMTALGRLILLRIPPAFYRGEEFLYAFLTGGVALSLLVFLLAAGHILSRGLLAAAGIAILGVAAWHRIWLPRGLPAPRLPALWRWLFWSLFAIFTVVYFANALAPEISPDGSSYHLGLVDRYLRQRGFERLTNHMYSNLSQGIEMQFLFAYAFGKHSAAAMIHFTYLVILPFQILFFAIRKGMSAAGVCAALLVYLSPVVGKDGISAYNDVALAAVLFGLFVLLEAWGEHRHAWLYVPIGLLAGFGYGIKYTAFLAFPFAAVWIGWTLWRDRQPLLRPLALLSVLAALSVAPWMIKNTIILGNPISPFGNRLFPNPNVTVDFERRYVNNLRNFNGVTWPEIPLEVTVKGQRLGGLLGPVFLIAPIALLALRDPLGRRLLLAGVVFGAAYLGNIGTRFLIPPLPFLALAMGMGLTRWPPVAMSVIVLHALLSWPWMIPRYSGEYPWKLQTIPWKAALRIQSPEAYFERWFPWFYTAKMIEMHVPPGRNVFSIDQLPEAYTTRNIVVLYQSAANHVLGDILWTPVIRDYHPTWRHTFRFDARALRAVRVVQTAAQAPHHWSISELHVWNAEEEVPRGALWLLKASAHPWDVQLAFDNSYVTRWRSWRDLEPGMRVEVDFGEPLVIDKVTLDLTHDQPLTRMRLEGQTAQGEWVKLAGESQIEDVPSPVAMRRAAIAELKARNIDYLLIHDENIGAEDLRTRARLWGITQVARDRNATLYRLE